MGALPDRLPGFQHVENDELAGEVRRGVGRHGPAEARLAPVGDVRRDGARRAARRSTSIGENPMQSEADRHRAEQLLRGLDTARRPGHLPDRDRPRSRTSSCRPPRPGPSPRAPSRTPSGASSACARRSMPPGEARDDLCDHLRPRAAAWAHDWGEPTAEAVWNEVRALSPVHAGMTLRAARGAGRPPVAVLRREAPGRAVPALAALGGPGAGQPRRRSCRSSTTRRSTASTTTSRSASRPGAASTRTTPASSRAATRSPLRRGETLDLSPEDARALRAGRGRARAGRLAARHGRGAGPGRRRRCGPASRS